MQSCTTLGLLFGFGCDRPVKLRFPWVALVSVINLSYELQEYRPLAFGTIYFRSAASEI